MMRHDQTIAGGAASAGLLAAGLISNGSPGAPLARCEEFDSLAKARLICGHGREPTPPAAEGVKRRASRLAAGRTAVEASQSDNRAGLTHHRRHRWGEPNRFTNPDRPDIGKTERECINGCGIIKVTVKPGGSSHPYQEFWKDGERIECEGTPVCEGGEK